MGLPVYLAATEQEIPGISSLPSHWAFMACHFSPYGTGLEPVPDLPAGGLLILDDRIPCTEHDPEKIAHQLKALAEEFQSSGVLLDFQSPPCPKSRDIAKAVCHVLSCPVAVSAGHCEQGAVFLPPVPPNQDPADYFAAWNNREIWLEAALDALQFTVTETGSLPLPLPRYHPKGICHRDGQFCCSYEIEVLEDRAIITLFRTPEDLDYLLAQAETLGVVQAVGLWQELRK